MIGDPNLTDIKINGILVKALIDSGYQVSSSITEEFYDNMDHKPELNSMDDFQKDLKGANGKTVPYTGYIEASIETQLTSTPILTILLVIPVSQYHGVAPVLLGTNLIRNIQQFRNTDNLPDGWEAAMMSINPFIGRVTATKLITLHSMETRTVTGFVRKIKNTDAAITEAFEDEHSHSAIVCPRVVTVNNAGRTSRIPVRICNVTARPIKIKARQCLCQ
ncbi:hypothetical protein DPMN_181756 [Dreissena polymorpha]|uniref:Uncharacterized protein n=1 Tax=Dreissena polymorpha TaxID=45954 RepID=A0A9D4DEB2_DREPO|nr:hypothetical protein DPMN_181756 [Dreissena polymorpha]